MSGASLITRGAHLWRYQTNITIKRSGASRALACRSLAARGGKSSRGGSRRRHISASQTSRTGALSWRMRAWPHAHEGNSAARMTQMPFSHVAALRRVARGSIYLIVRISRFCAAFFKSAYAAALASQRLCLGMLCIMNMQRLASYLAHAAWRGMPSSKHRGVSKQVASCRMASTGISFMRHSAASLNRSCRRRCTSWWYVCGAR